MDFMGTCSTGNTNMSLLGSGTFIEYLDFHGCFLVLYSHICVRILPFELHLMKM